MLRRGRRSSERPSIREVCFMSRLLPRRVVAFVLLAALALVPAWADRPAPPDVARLNKNRQTTEQDLEDALQDVLAGKAVRKPATRAIGCQIQRDRAVKKDGKVTYYRDVLPILQTHCQQCHRPGEVGPFALMTYRQAASWADDIKTYTQEKKMPPWKPVDGPAYHNERRLPAADIQTLAAWADNG